MSVWNGCKFDCSARIGLAWTRLILDKRFQAVGIYYWTKNAVKTVKQLQFECEATFRTQFFHSFDGMPVPLINSDGLNTFV